ncbi:MAG TPA: transposase [Clostridium sp.]|uniref:transposase n=1 Tax=Clostridium sp. TaxID=1506 RepID=UPI002F920FF5
MKKNTSTFVLTLPLVTSISDKSALDKYFELSRKYYNAVLGKLLKRHYLMIQSKKYMVASKLPKGKERDRLFNELEREYGIKGTMLNKLITSLRTNEFKSLGSHITIKLQLRASLAIDRLKYKVAKKINFIKYAEMRSFESSDNIQGIKFRDNVIIFNKLKLPIIINRNDIYAHIALQDRVKYCRIKREFIKGKYHYYVQLILEGIPPTKFNKKTGEIRHYINDGFVGLDIGTQTIGICSNSEVKLLELVPEVKNIERQKRTLQRKMDRSRIITNPNKYNENNTIKNNDNSKWNKSKHYIKIQMKFKELFRKQREIRKQSHNKLANYVLTLGNNIKVETMNYKGLQARAKNTTINEKTGKFNKKKRFGKSLANKAPSMFLTILDNKLKWIDKELKKINTWKVKASQYNHIEDKFIKKELNDRWNDFGDFKIQRDLYSSFLIMNVNDDLSSINKDLCFKKFQEFKILHDIEVKRLKNLVLPVALKNVI